MRRLSLSVGVWLPLSASGRGPLLGRHNFATIPLGVTVLATSCANAIWLKLPKIGRVFLLEMCGRVIGDLFGSFIDSIIRGSAKNSAADLSFGHDLSKLLARYTRKHDFYRQVTFTRVPDTTGEPPLESATCVELQEPIRQCDFVASLKSPFVNSSSSSFCLNVVSASEGTVTVDCPSTTVIELAFRDSPASMTIVLPVPQLAKTMHTPNMQNSA
jgi:hypothetical protein